MNLKTFLALASFFISLPTLSAPIETLGDWAKDGRITSISGSEGTGFGFSAYIAHSKNGEQRLYFETIRFENHENVKICDPESEQENTVLTINGQPVKFFTYCNTDKNKTITQSMTAQSNAGTEFVINTFKGSNQVTISVGSFKISIPANGFTKAWNNAGGDAL
ncbi:hypothetical protein [Vibrio europaeus]|uniref:hypothetical protein n=1 Tax=Vibrio europaeus TaxID=300876 RepID=UPI00233EEED7|nr:hypothetical protein [Vibrio europaeus]MDC5855529.1 hypothetical protein [Vibrio europaeus]